MSALAVAGNGTSRRGGLTRRQTRALTALLARKTVVAAAAAASVGERTLRRWLTEPTFKAALRRAQEHALEAAQGALMGAAEQTAQELIRLALAKKGEANVKLRACALVLEHAGNGLDADVSERLAMLERTLRARR